MSVCEYAAPNIIPLLDMVRSLMLDTYHPWYYLVVREWEDPVGVELRHNVGDLYHQQSKKEKDDIPGTAYIAGKEVSCDDYG